MMSEYLDNEDSDSIPISISVITVIMGYTFDLFDWVVVIYLALHIPTTLLVDAQTVLPADLFPQQLKDLLAWHVETNKDPFVGVDARPAWFVGITLIEVLLQVPYFVVALYAWAHCCSWIRVPTIVYGAHTATTLIPILAELLAMVGVTLQQRATIIAVYLPYLLMPLAMLWRAASRTDMFPSVAATKQRHGKAQ